MHAQRDRMKKVEYYPNISIILETCKIKESLQRKQFGSNCCFGKLLFWQYLHGFHTKSNENKLICGITYHAEYGVQTCKYLLSPMFFFFNLAHLSQRLIGEHIVYPCSCVCCLSVVFHNFKYHLL